MRTSLLPALVLGVAGLLTASPGMGAETAEEAVRAAVQGFEAAVNKGDAAALARMYTPQAAVMPPGTARVDGREAIEQVWRQSMEQGGVKDMSIRSTEVTVVGSTAYEVGTATLTEKDAKGGVRPGSVKYLHVWQRGEDGMWRLHREIWNENPRQGQ